MSRLVCSALEEMRDAIKVWDHLNPDAPTFSTYRHLKSLIEETQTMVNRMEAALWDQKRLDDLRDDIKQLKKERKELKDVLGKNTNKETMYDL
jgi:hypothetical protein